MSRTVADIIVDNLAKGGVERIYGVPGDSIDPLVEAIRRKRLIKYVQVRHEEGAAFAASFEAKLTGKPAACFGTSGPGSIHLLNGLYDAKMDKAPVIAITGQVETGKIGHDAHQEVNMTKLLDDVAVFNRLLLSPDSAPYLVSRAIREAKRLSGVSHLNVPVDIMRTSIDSSQEYSTESPEPAFMPDLDHVVNIVQMSRKPVILAGRGALGRSSAITELSEKTGAPIIYALMGKGIVADDDRRVLGGLGLLGTRPSFDAVQASDLIIEIGSTFPYRKFIPEKSRIIQVDVDAGNLEREFPVDAAILSDSHRFIKSILPRISEKKIKFYTEFYSARRKWEKELEVQERSDNGIVNPAKLARVLSEEADSNAVVVTDTGNTTLWIARHFRAEAGQRFLFSGGLASMGNGLPGAIGVTMSTDRQVIAAVGDGGFAMTMAELATVKKYNVPVKIVIFNNSKLGMIKYEQEVLGYPEWGVDLVNPDFAGIASAYDIEATRVKSNVSLKEGIRKMLDSDGPFILEAITDPRAKPMPPKVTFEQARGYLAANAREKIGYTPEIMR